MPHVERLSLLNSKDWIDGTSACVNGTSARYISSCRRQAKESVCVEKVFPADVKVDVYGYVYIW
jgi:hypothetical protein